MSASPGDADRWPLYDGAPDRGRSYLKVWPYALCVGARFATEFETGCQVTAGPDEHGNFLALDSDGVECRFTILMVVRIEG